MLKLYRQFKLDEPWDSVHNAALLERMPNIYAPVGLDGQEKHATFCQAFVGPGLVFDDQMAMPAVTLREVVNSDGAGNTLLIVEGDAAVPWTKPADLSFRPEAAPPNLGARSKQGVHVCFCDRSVYAIKKELPDRLIQQLASFRDRRLEPVADYMFLVKNRPRN